MLAKPTANEFLCIGFSNNNWPIIARWFLEIYVWYHYHPKHKSRLLLFLPADQENDSWYSLILVSCCLNVGSGDSEKFVGSGCWPTFSYQALVLGFPSLPQQQQIAKKTQESPASTNRNTARTYRRKIGEPEDHHQRNNTHGRKHVEELENHHQSNNTQGRKQNSKGRIRENRVRIQNQWNSIWLDNTITLLKERCR